MPVTTASQKDLVSNLDACARAARTGHANVLHFGSLVIQQLEKESALKHVVFTGEYVRAIAAFAAATLVANPSDSMQQVLSALTLLQEAVVIVPSAFDNIAATLLVSAVCGSLGTLPQSGLQCVLELLRQGSTVSSAFRKVLCDCTSLSGAVASQSLSSSPVILLLRNAIAPPLYRGQLPAPTELASPALATALEIFGGCSLSHDVLHEVASEGLFAQLATLAVRGLSMKPPAAGAAVALRALVAASGCSAAVESVIGAGIMTSLTAYLTSLGATYSNAKWISCVRAVLLLVGALLRVCCAETAVAPCGACDVDVAGAFVDIGGTHGIVVALRAVQLQSVPSGVDGTADISAALEVLIALSQSKHSQRRHAIVTAGAETIFWDILDNTPAGSRTVMQALELLAMTLGDSTSRIAQAAPASNQGLPRTTETVIRIALDVLSNDASSAEATGHASRALTYLAHVATDVPSLGFADGSLILKLLSAARSALPRPTVLVHILNLMSKCITNSRAATIEPLADEVISLATCAVYGRNAGHAPQIFDVVVAIIWAVGQLNPSSSSLRATLPGLFRLWTSLFPCYGDVKDVEILISSLNSAAKLCAIVALVLSGSTKVAQDLPSRLLVTQEMLEMTRASALGFDFLTSTSSAFSPRLRDELLRVASECSAQSFWCIGAFPRSDLPVECLPSLLRDGLRIISIAQSLGRLRLIESVLIALHSVTSGCSESSPVSFEDKNAVLRVILDMLGRLPRDAPDEDRCVFASAVGLFANLCCSGVFLQHSHVPTNEEQSSVQRRISVSTVLLELLESKTTGSVALINGFRALGNALRCSAAPRDLSQHLLDCGVAAAIGSVLKTIGGAAKAPAPPPAVLAVGPIAAWAAIPFIVAFPAKIREFGVRLSDITAIASLLSLRIQALSESASDKSAVDNFVEAEPEKLASHLAYICSCFVALLKEVRRSGGISVNNDGSQAASVLECAGAVVVELLYCVYLMRDAYPSLHIYADVETCAWSAVGEAQRLNVGIQSSDRTMRLQDVLKTRYAGSVSGRRTSKPDKPAPVLVTIARSAMKSSSLALRSAAIPVIAMYSITLRYPELTSLVLSFLTQSLIDVHVHASFTTSPADLDGQGSLGGTVVDDDASERLHLGHGSSCPCESVNLIFSTLFNEDVGVVVSLYPSLAREILSMIPYVPSALPLAHELVFSPASNFVPCLADVAVLCNALVCLNSAVQLASGVNNIENSSDQSSQSAAIGASDYSVLSDRFSSICTLLASLCERPFQKGGKAGLTLAKSCVSNLLSTIHWRVPSVASCCLCQCCGHLGGRCGSAGPLRALAAVISADAQICETARSLCFVPQGIVPRLHPLLTAILLSTKENAHLCSGVIDGMRFLGSLTMPRADLTPLTVNLSVMHILPVLFLLSMRRSLSALCETPANRGGLWCSLLRISNSGLRGIVAKNSDGVISGLTSQEFCAVVDGLHAALKALFDGGNMCPRCSDQSGQRHSHCFALIGTFTAVAALIHEFSMAKSVNATVPGNCLSNLSSGVGGLSKALCVFICAHRGSCDVFNPALSVFYHLLLDSEEFTYDSAAFLAQVPLHAHSPCILPLTMVVCSSPQCDRQALSRQLHTAVRYLADYSLLSECLVEAARDPSLPVVIATDEAAQLGCAKNVFYESAGFFVALIASQCVVSGRIASSNTPDLSSALADSMSLLCTLHYPASLRQVVSTFLSRHSCPLIPLAMFTLVALDCNPDLLLKVLQNSPQPALWSVVDEFFHAKNVRFSATLDELIIRQNELLFPSPLWLVCLRKLAEVAVAYPPDRVTAFFETIRSSAPSRPPSIEFHPHAPLQGSDQNSGASRIAELENSLKEATDRAALSEANYAASAEKLSQSEENRKELELEVSGLADRLTALQSDLRVREEMLQNTQKEAIEQIKLNSELTLQHNKSTAELNSLREEVAAHPNVVATTELLQSLRSSVNTVEMQRDQAYQQVEELLALLQVHWKGLKSVASGVSSTPSSEVDVASMSPRWCSSTPLNDIRRALEEELSQIQNWVTKAVSRDNQPGSISLSSFDPEVKKKLLNLRAQYLPTTNLESGSVASGWPPIVDDLPPLPTGTPPSPTTSRTRKRASAEACDDDDMVDAPESTYEEAEEEDEEDELVGDAYDAIDPYLVIESLRKRIKMLETSYDRTVEAVVLSNSDYGVSITAEEVKQQTREALAAAEAGRAEAAERASAAEEALAAAEAGRAEAAGRASAAEEALAAAEARRAEAAGRASAEQAAYRDLQKAMDAALSENSSNAAVARRLSDEHIRSLQLTIQSLNTEVSLLKRSVPPDSSTLWARAKELEEREVDVQRRFDAVENKEMEMEAATAKASRADAMLAAAEARISAAAEAEAAAAAVDMDAHNAQLAAEDAASKLAARESALSELKLELDAKAEELRRLEMVLHDAELQNSSPERISVAPAPVHLSSGHRNGGAGGDGYPTRGPSGLTGMSVEHLQALQRIQKLEAEIRYLQEELKSRRHVSIDPPFADSCSMPLSPSVASPVQSSDAGISSAEVILKEFTDSLVTAVAPAESSVQTSGSWASKVGAGELSGAPERRAKLIDTVSCLANHFATFTGQGRSAHIHRTSSPLRQGSLIGRRQGSYHGDRDPGVEFPSPLSWDDTLSESKPAIPSRRYHRPSKSDEDLSGTLTSIRVDRVTTSSATVRWTIAGGSERESCSTTYLVNLLAVSGKLEGPQDAVTVVLDSSARRATFPGLKSSTRYRVAVTAISDCDAGVVLTHEFVTPASSSPMHSESATPPASTIKDSEI